MEQEHGRYRHRRHSECAGGTKKRKRCFCNELYLNPILRVGLGDVAIPFCSFATTIHAAAALLGIISSEAMHKAAFSVRIAQRDIPAYRYSS
jgi:hypothetical protein